MKYFSNFEGSIGSQPTGWTKHDSEGLTSFVLEYGTPAFKRRQVRAAVLSGSSGARALSLDAVDADAGRADFDILMLFKVPSGSPTEAPTSIYLTGRATGANFIDNAYFTRVVVSSGLFTVRTVAGGTVGAALATTTLGALTAGASYFYRFRVQTLAGSPTTNRLQAKLWLSTVDEPAAWQLEVDHASSLGAGYVGFGGSLAGSGSYYEVCTFSAGTAGDVAPTPLTNERFTEWLDSPAERRVLASITAIGYNPSGVPSFDIDRDFYIANGGYNSKSWDSPANQHFAPAILTIPTLRQEMTLALGGPANVGFGSLVVSVTEGSGREQWPRMKWKKDFVILEIGDPSWPKHDFRIYLKGRLQAPTAPAAHDALEFPINDLLDILNEPIQPNRYTALGSPTPIVPFEGHLKPLLFGSVRFMEPVPTSAATLEQQIHDATSPVGGVISIDTVYDDGVDLKGTASVTAATPATDILTVVNDWAAGDRVRWDAPGPGSPTSTLPAPFVAGTDYYVISDSLSSTQAKLSATIGGSAVNISSTGTAGPWSVVKRAWYEDLANGKITLSHNPIGRIMVKNPSTGAVDPTSGYHTVADVIDDVIFEHYGLSRDYQDVDTFDALRIAVPDPCGTQLYDEQITAGDFLERISRGTNVWYTIAPDALLQVGRLSLPAAVASMEFKESDVKDGSLRLESRMPPFNRDTFSWRIARNYYLNGPLNLAPYKYYELLRDYLTLPATGWQTYVLQVTPLDDVPWYGDTFEYGQLDTLFNLPTIETFDGDGYEKNERGRLTKLHTYMLGIFSFQTRLSAIELSIGQTISLEHSRLGWKEWTPSDPSSDDNSNTIDSRLAVVIGKDVSINADDPFPVKLTVFRRIPGYYPAS